MRLGLRWACLALISLFLVGCAGTRTVDQQSATVLLNNSDYRGYANLYLDFTGKPKYDPDSLLDALEAGKAFNDAGLWEYSRDAFAAAEQKLLWKEDTIDTPEEVASLIGTTLTSDAFGPYQGKIHQGSLIDYYQAINHLMLGDEDNARVDFNRLQVRQSNAVRQLNAFAKTVNKSVKEDIKSDETDTARKTIGEVGPMVADGIKDLPSGLTKAKVRLAAGDVASAVFRSTSSAQSDKSSNLVRDMLRSANRASATRGGNAMITYLGREINRNRGKLKNKVIVIYEDGIGPGLKEFRIDLPLFILTDKVSYTGIALPQFVNGTQSFGSLYLGEGKGRGETATLTNINELSALEFDAAYKGIVSKAVVSAIIKTTAQVLIHKKLDEEADPLIGSILKIGTGLVQATLTQADTRAWANLPNTIQMAVVDRPANGTLKIFSKAGKLLAERSITKDVNTLLLIKAAGAFNNPAIYQQELPVENPVPSLLDSDVPEQTVAEEA